MAELRPRDEMSENRLNQCGQAIIDHCKGLTRFNINQTQIARSMQSPTQVTPVSAFGIDALFLFSTYRGAYRCGQEG